MTRPKPGLRRSAMHKLAARIAQPLDPRILEKLAGPLPTSTDLTVLPPTDQGQTSSCTAHALMKIVEITAGYRGSMRTLYAQTGAMQGDPSDDGRELLDCLDAIAHLGVAPFEGPVEGRNSDVTQANATLPVTPAEASAADMRRINLGRSSIDPAASNACNVVVASLAAGGPIYLGARVGDAFDGLQGATVAQPDPVNDPTAVGHALALVGHRTMPDGLRQFKIENSWGEWDDKGECWVSEAWLHACFELHPCLPPVASSPQPSKAPHRRQPTHGDPRDSPPNRGHAVSGHLLDVERLQHIARELVP